MKRMILSGLVALIAIGFWSGTAEAGPKDGQGFGMDGADGCPFAEEGARGHHGGKWLRHLDLTTEQRAEVKALGDTHRAEVEPLFAKMEELREQMHALWTSESPDEGAIIALHAQMDPIRDELQRSKVRFRIAVIDLLTPEQNAKRIELMTERAERRGEKGERKGRGKGKGKGLGPR